MLVSRVSRSVIRNRLVASLALRRTLHTSSPSRFSAAAEAKPAATFVDVPAPISSWWSRLVSKSSTYPRALPSEAFPGAPDTTQTEATLTSASNVSTLSNGVRVASLSDSSSPLVSVGVVVSSGSRDETNGTDGLAHAIELAATSSTTNATDIAWQRQMAIQAANIIATAGRETTTYTSPALLSNAPQVFNLIADIVQNPAFLEFEVKNLRDTYKFEIDQRDKQADFKIFEAIHEAAFGTDGLGRSTLGAAKQAAAVSANTLKTWHASKFAANRIVVAAVGVPHEQLVALAEATFGKLPAATGGKRTPSKFVAGDIRQHDAAATETNLVIAFQAPGLGDKDFVAAQLLQTLLGNCGLTGSRLARAAAASNGLKRASSLNPVYSDSGLFGVYLNSAASTSAELAKLASTELKALAASISSEDLQRAKQQLRASIVTLLEDRAFKLDDLGKQLLSTGSFTSTADVVAQVDKISADQLQQLARKILSTPPAVAAIGNLSSVPRYEVIASSFKF